MVSFPNCKINLGLHILGKRPDGFHNLETFFYPIPLKDGLEIVHNPAPGASGPLLTVSGLPLDIDTSNNICIKAYELLKKDFPDLPPVQMHLHKAIPNGAGLGGGSADGAFCLVLLNKKFNLGLDQKRLLTYAAILGSDCPFFIKNRPCFASGRGELLEEVSIDLASYRLIVVNPGITVNTGWAFSNLRACHHRVPLKEAIQMPVSQWAGSLTNDFEETVFNAHPELAAIKDQIYGAGATYAAMSGTGSTVYGLFPNACCPALQFPPHYFLREFAIN